MKRLLAYGTAAAMLLAAAVPVKALSPVPRTWQDESIYFIMIDRFHNGDPTNDGNANPRDIRTWHGGDLQGVIDKLDYIKSLGFTAIWITPHVENTGGDYHGYGAVDFFDTDPHFGTIAKTKELVDKAHDRGMKVIFDIVVNHTGPRNPLVGEHPDWFHPKCEIRNWNNPKEVQDCWIFALPDFDQSKPEVRDYILKYSQFWVQETGVDGFRLDTVRHVPAEFFTWYMGELKKTKPDFWAIGEVWEQAYFKLQPYQKAGVPALVDFPVSEMARSVFGKDAGFNNLSGKIMESKRVMQDPYQLGAFLDNHDMSRFVTEAKQDDPIGRLKLGLTWLMTYRSIPIVYYGTEIGMKGANDPYNRADFPWGSETNLDVRDLVTKLNAIRQQHAALRYGDFEELLIEQTHYAYSRKVNGDQVIVVLNNDGQQPLQRDIPAGGLADGTVLREELTGTRVTVSGGTIKADVAPRSGAIYAVAPAAPGRAPGVLWGALGGLVLLVGAVGWSRSRRGR